MLDTNFPRVQGDIGNPDSFDFPVIHKIVGGATADLVVRNRAEGTLDAFVDAGRELVAQGCVGITTTCGFLTLFQRELVAALDIPVMTSALFQTNAISAALPAGRKVGVLTISAESLTPEHLAAADVPAGTPVAGIGEGHLKEVIFDDLPELDTLLAEAEMVEAACDLCARHPEVGALLFECANMPPYADAVRAAVGLPVFSALTMANWFYDGL